MQSEQIDQLAAALAAAQGEITGALKDSSNPFFKSKYADLAACWDACRAALSKHGLCVMQPTIDKDGQVYVVTTLAHSSGQWIRGWLPVKTKDDSAQGQGSGLTYARRYALAGMVGLAQIDDDAEAAQGRKASVADTGDTLSPKQQQFATEFANAIVAALHADKDEDAIATDIAQLNTELSEDKLIGVAAWSLLNSKDRAAFKKYLKQEKSA
jgi:hypothetical protein